MRTFLSTALMVFAGFRCGPVMAVDEYRLDDGIKEQGIGIQASSPVSFSMAWLNHFVVTSGNETITGVNISFGGGLTANNIANGSSLTVYLWGDGNGDGDPSDASVLRSVTDVVAGSGTNTRTTYTFINPITLPVGTSIFAGAIINYPSQVLVASIDTDGSDSIPQYPPSASSWIAGSSNGSPVMPGSLATAQLPVARVSNAIFGGVKDGTWIIRMNAATTSGTPLLTVTPDPLDFGQTNVGAVVGPATLQLENIGTADLNVSQIDPIPLPFNDIGTGTCTMPPFVLIPGDSCTLELEFAPVTVGVFDYSLGITSNDPTSPTLFRLRGESLPPGGGGIFSDGFE
ncbi:MAG: choice-of-anchor D domain-containing protein [Xanthomonadales bacterium]|nr:choice-of-anchor D domain-containing protein [Xanthomonadales bacterium]